MDQTVSLPTSKRVHWTIDRIREKVLSSRVVVFAKKGKFGRPTCGYSERAVTAVKNLGRPYEVVNISEEPSIRAALKAFSGVNEVPQVFIDGILVRSGATPHLKLTGGDFAEQLEQVFSK